MGGGAGGGDVGVNGGGGGAGGHRTSFPGGTKITIDSKVSIFTPLDRFCYTTDLTKNL